MYLYVKKRPAEGERTTDLYRSEEELALLPEEDKQIDYEHFHDFPKQEFYFLPEVWQIGYWRKANAIHNWFVENCAGGIDNCEEVLIHPEQLMDLREKCLEVIENPIRAADLLPTTVGFFFGSIDYDEWYIQELKDTVEIIDRVRLFPGHDIIYAASW